MKQNHSIYGGLLGVILYSISLLAADVKSAQSSDNLVWDGETKATSVESGETGAHLIFNFTNISACSITITNVHPSCGCTTAQLPTLPWIIPSGTNGWIGITVNLAGKSGTLFKTVTVNTDKGSQSLSVKIAILPPATPDASTTNKSRTLQVSSKGNGVAVAFPAKQSSDLPAAQAMIDPNRARSFQMAKVDRQAVFKGDCASCHATPAKGKSGKELYDLVCGICHESANRATMVPDLHHLKVPTSVDFWKTWITLGKTNSFMPAFARAEGGPLTKSQITSIAKYLTKTIPSQTNQFQ